MRIRTSWLWGSVGVCALFGLRLLAWEHAPESDANRDAQLPGLMLAKLGNTQRIVAGLVSKNFVEIARGAEDMLRVCDAEEWESHPDPVYAQHRSDLRRQATKLTDLANAHNLEGAAFNYIQTISTCISCHEHCRDVLRIAQIPSTGVISIPTSDQDARWTGMPILRR